MAIAAAHSRRPTATDAGPLLTTNASAAPTKPSRKPAAIQPATPTIARTYHGAAVSPVAGISPVASPAARSRSHAAARSLIGQSPPGSPTAWAAPPPSAGGGERLGRRSCRLLPRDLPQPPRSRARHRDDGQPDEEEARRRLALEEPPGERRGDDDDHAQHGAGE